MSRSSVCASHPLRVVIALTGAVALGACSSISGSDAKPNRYAALNVAAQNNGTDAAKGAATLVFFEGVNVSVPNSARQQFDQCIVSGIDTATVSVTGMNTVTTTPTLAVGARSVPLTYNAARLRFETSASAPLTYGTGESATITIPESGTVFPNSTLTLKLAEPLVPAPLSLPAPNADWTIRWNGTNDNVSSIQLQLRYATNPSLTAPNEQVYCVLVDDGSITLPASYTTGFLASPPAARSIRMLRWRTNERVIDANTLLHLTSTIDTVIRFP